MDIRIEHGQVLITGPKCVMVLTKAQFIEALRRGKAYRRREAMAAHMASAEPSTLKKRGRGSP